MKNDFEPSADGSIRVYMQNRDGQQLHVDISAASLIKLQDFDHRIYSVSINGIERAVIPFTEGGKPKHVYLSRYLKATPEDMVCVSISGDTTDYRLSNLINLSTAEAAQYKRKLQSNNKTGIRGVSLDKPTGKYRAQAQLEGRRIYLGLYPSAEEAGQVAAEFRREHMPYSQMDQQAGTGITV